MAERKYSFTRDQLVDALMLLEVRVKLSGPAEGLIVAENFADALLEALAKPRLPPKWHGHDYAVRRARDIRQRMPFHVVAAINDDVSWLLDDLGWLREGKKP